MQSACSGNEPLWSPDSDCLPCPLTSPSFLASPRVSTSSLSFLYLSCFIAPPPPPQALPLPSSPYPAPSSLTASLPHDDQWESRGGVTFLRNKVEWGKKQKETGLRVDWVGSRGEELAGLGGGGRDGSACRGVGLTCWRSLHCFINKLAGCQEWPCSRNQSRQGRY